MKTIFLEAKVQFFLKAFWMFEEEQDWIENKEIYSRFCMGEKKAGWQKKILKMPAIVQMQLWRCLLDKKLFKHKIAYYI